MGAGNIFGLLFEINPDPSKAQQAFRAFEASIPTQLKNIGTEFDELQNKSGDALKLLRNQLALAAGDFERLNRQFLNAEHCAARFDEEMKRAAAQKSVQANQESGAGPRGDIPNFAMPIRELIPPMAEFDRTVGSISRRLTDQLAPSFHQSGEAARTFGQTVANALIRATDASKGSVAMESARLAATVGFRRVAAGIEAVWETAKSIAAFAEWDIRGGILHAMSAAEYGIIAGTGGGRRGGYGAGGGRMPGELSHGRPVLGAGAGVDSRLRGNDSGRGGGPAVINLNIQGDFLAAPATIDMLADQLSQAVDRRDVVLKASHVKDSTLTRDSLNG